MNHKLSVLEAARVAAFAVVTVNLCIAHGASVTSGFRTKQRNARAGGSPTSFHLEGLANDLVPEDKAESAALVTAARAEGLDAVDEGDHVHIELDYRRPA